MDGTTPVCLLRQELSLTSPLSLTPHEQCIGQSHQLYQTMSFTSHPLHSPCYKPIQAVILSCPLTRPLPSTLASPLLHSLSSEAARMFSQAPLISHSLMASHCDQNKIQSPHWAFTSPSFSSGPFPFTLPQLYWPLCL